MQARMTRATTSRYTYTSSKVALNVLVGYGEELISTRGKVDEDGILRDAWNSRWHLRISVISVIMNDDFSRTLLRGFSFAPR